MEKILKMQKKLNDDVFLRAYGKTFVRTFKTCPETFTLDFTRAMIHEIFELKEELQRKKSSEQNIGIELVDILHFLISIYIGWDFKYELVEAPPTNPVTEETKKVASLMKLDNLLQSIISLENACQWKWWKYYDPLSKDDIQKLEHILGLTNVDYWLLVQACGFSVQEIKDIYIQKNELNFARQKGGYGKEYKKVIDGQEDNKKIKVIRGGKEVK